MHPGQTTGDETHAAQFSRWGLGRRCIPAEPRRFAPLILAFRSKYTRASSPGGGSSLTRLVSRASHRPRRSRGFHHRLFTAPLRGARRCASVEIHPVFLPRAPCQPGASPVSALTWVSPQAVTALYMLECRVAVWRGPAGSCAGWTPDRFDLARACCPFPPGIPCPESWRDLSVR